MDSKYLVTDTKIPTKLFYEHYCCLLKTSGNFHKLLCLTFVVVRLVVAVHLELDVAARPVPARLAEALPGQLVGGGAGPVPVAVSRTSYAKVTVSSTEQRSKVHSRQCCESLY